MEKWLMDPDGSVMQLFVVWSNRQDSKGSQLPSLLGCA